MTRWLEFTDRELRLIYRSIASLEARSAQKLVEELVIEADSRGSYRSRHIFEGGGPQDLLRAATSSTAKS